MNRRTIDIIEDAVTVPDVLRLHGTEPNRRGRCRCPVCGSSRDAFSYTDRLFHCFSCGESGGVIQLESVLSCVSLDQACYLLSTQYGLDISDRPLSAEDRSNWRLEKRVEKSYEDWQEQKAAYYRRMTNLFRNIKNVPELYDMAKNLRDWLDENINGVTRPWLWKSTD